MARKIIAGLFAGALALLGQIPEAGPVAGGNGGGGSTSLALSALTSATATNTLSNGIETQTWNWSFGASNSLSGMLFGETATGSGSGNFLITINAATGSTTQGLNVKNRPTGSQTGTALRVSPVWNTSGVVDAALVVDVTNTASGTGSLLEDIQVNDTSQWKVDTLGNGTLLGAFNAGSISGPLASSSVFGVVKVDGTTITAAGGVITAPGTGGTVTNIATTAPLTGGPITSTGTIGCATCTITIANGTATLGTGAIASGACATTVTVAGTGVATTDDIIADFNASPLAVTGYTASANGMLTIIKWPTSGNVNFAVCNNTAASITPGAITLNWRVVR